MGFTLVCDPGVDDVVALAVLVGLGHPPDAVVAVAGNVTAERAAANAAGACALLGLDVPVLVEQGGRQPRERSRHGPDGFAGLADLLPEAPAPMPLTSIEGDVLAIGPLTAVARHAPGGRVLWLGGGFNQAADPGAVGAATEVLPVEVSGRVLVAAEAGPPLVIEAMNRFGPVVHDAVAAIAWCRPERFTWQRGRAVGVEAVGVAGDIAEALARVPWVA